MNADVPMLDEPTGGLDVGNTKWPENWIDSFPGSIFCASHFSPFLEKTCTHIIGFQDRKLKTFNNGMNGTTLTQLVGMYPDMKACYVLTNETVAFPFPLPGQMEGVQSRPKVVHRVSNVTFQYPTKEKPTIVGVRLCR